MWSLGITLIELALGRFPFSESSDDSESEFSDLDGTLSPSRPGGMSLENRLKQKKKKDKRKSKGVSLQGGRMMMSILELLQHIVNEPAPKLTPEGRYPREAENFVNACLSKDPEQRKTPKDLLVCQLLGISLGSAHKIIVRCIHGSRKPKHPIPMSWHGRTRFSSANGFVIPSHPHSPGGAQVLPHLHTVQPHWLLTGVFGLFLRSGSFITLFSLVCGAIIVNMYFLELDRGVTRCLVYSVHTMAKNSCLILLWPPT